MDRQINMARSIRLVILNKNIYSYGVGNASIYLLNTFRRVLALWTFVDVRVGVDPAFAAEEQQECFIRIPTT